MRAIPTFETGGVDEAATILFVSALKSVVKKGVGAPLSAWEVTAIEAIERATGAEILERETIEGKAAKARHQLRGPKGSFIAADTSEHLLADGSVVAWKHCGASLARRT